MNHGEAGSVASGTWGGPSLCLRHPAPCQSTRQSLRICLKRLTCD